MGMFALVHIMDDMFVFACEISIKFVNCLCREKYNKYIHIFGVKNCEKACQRKVDY